jgi:hypothetical protein
VERQRQSSGPAPQCRCAFYVARARLSTVVAPLAQTLGLAIPARTSSDRFLLPHLRTMNQIAVLLSALMCYAVAAPVQASDWKEVPGSSDGRRALIDLARITQDGPYKKAWMVSEWPTDQAIQTLKYRSVLQLDLYDCRTAKIATKSMHLYSNPDASGKLIRAIEVEDSRLKWMEIPPESGLDTGYKIVCNR